MANLVLYDLADLTTPIRTIDTITALEWRDRINDVPESTLTIQNDADELADLDYGRVLQVRIDDQPVHAFLIEKKSDDHVEVDTGKQVTKISGRPTVAMMDRGAVAPGLGYDRKPWSTSRTFSFASREFTPDGSWIAASILPIGPGEPGRFYLPTGFPAADVPGIGPSGGDDFVDGAPIGFYYLIYDPNDDGSGLFHLDDDTILVIFSAADDQAEIFADGYQLARYGGGNYDPTGSAFNTTHMSTVFLTAGDHRLAVKAANTDFAGDPGTGGMGATLPGNPTMFLAVGYAADSTGRLLSRVFATGEHWLILAYPDDPPGMTIGQIAGILLDEAHADGGDLTLVGKDFDDVNDSAGNPWDVLEQVTVQVGDSLLATLQSWALAYCDFAFPPDALTLRMWRYEERGVASGVEYSLANKNLASQSFDGVDVGTDCLIVSWAGPQFRHPSSGGSRLGYLQTNAKTRAEAAFLAGQVIARQQAQITQVTFAVAPTSSADTPGLVPVGDTVTVPDQAGGTLEERLMEIAGTFVDRGWQFAVSVRDVHLSDADRLQLVLQRMANGGLGGTAPSSPADPPPLFGTKINSSEVTFNLTDPPVTGESPDKIPLGSGNLYAVMFTIKAGTEEPSIDLTFEMLVDGVDVLGGTGVIPHGTGSLLLPVDPIVWVAGNRLAVNITEAGATCLGMVIEPRFI